MKTIYRMIQILFVGGVGFIGIDCFCESSKAPQQEKILGYVDFNTDGRVDESDLLMLIPNIGKDMGEKEFDFQYDLHSDGKTDYADLLDFIYAWQQIPEKFAPVPIDEFRQMTGLNDLVGKTWYFKCIEGGVPDCSGEGRTITGGQIIEMDGRLVLPITWGDESGEPWDRLYITMDGKLTVMGIEKLGESDEIPGFSIPPQMIQLSGPVDWTTSEMVYHGGVSEGSVEASFDLNAKFLGKSAQVSITNICNFFIMAMMKAATGYYPDAPTPSATSEVTPAFTPDITPEVTPNISGLSEAVTDTMILLTGNERFSYPLPGGTSIETLHSHWEALLSASGAHYFHLCWDHLGQEKCQAFLRVPDPPPTVTPTPTFTPTETPEDVCIAEVEPNDASATANILPVGECSSGEINRMVDPQDFFKIPVEAEGTLNIQVVYTSTAAVHAYIYDKDYNELQHRSYLPGENIPLTFYAIQVVRGDSFFLRIQPNGGQTTYTVYTSGPAVTYTPTPEGTDTPTPTITETPTQGEHCEVVEVEPNNSFAEADQLAVNGCLNGSVAWDDYMDVHRMDLGADVSGSLIVSITYSNIDNSVMMADLYADEETMIQSSSTLIGQGSFSFEPVTANPLDDYFLYISAEGVGNYDVSASLK